MKLKINTDHMLLNLKSKSKSREREKARHRFEKRIFPIFGIYDLLRNKRKRARDVRITGGHEKARVVYDIIFFLFYLFPLNETEKK